jgi:hypothetical protein
VSEVLQGISLEMLQVLQGMPLDMSQVLTLRVCRMARSNTQLEKRVYAPEPVVSCSADNTALHEQLMGILHTALSKQVREDLPSELRVMHKEACKSICAVSLTVRCVNSTVLVPTQINVYFVWIAWMEVMCCSMFPPMHPKTVHIQYFKGMTLEKLAVLIPAVCFSLCQKCSETWNVTCSQLERVIAAVQAAKNIRSFQCTVQEVVDAEHAVVQLLDFDILKQQENVDAIEDILRQKFEDFEHIHDCVNTQTEVARALYQTFHDVM